MTNNKDRQPFKPSRCFKASFYIPENRPNFHTAKCFRTNIFMKLVCQYMPILFNFKTTSNRLHPLQVENCDSNSQLVVDEDDDGKFRPERVKSYDVLSHTDPVLLLLQDEWEVVQENQDKMMKQLATVRTRVKQLDQQNQQMASMLTAIVKHHNIELEDEDFIADEDGAN